MPEPVRTIESIGLELAALRVEHTLQANLIGRLADALFMSPLERDTLAMLEAEIEEVAAWAAGCGSPLTRPGGWSPRSGLRD
jgi:hypothetical protein